MTDDIDIEPVSDDEDAGFGIVPRYLRKKLSGYEIAVYVALSWRVDDYGECYLRHQRLADEAGLSLATCKRALESLRDKGIVSWRQKVGEHGGVLCNVYRLEVFQGRRGGSHSTTPQLSLSEGVALTERQNENPLTRPQEDLVGDAAECGIGQRLELTQLCEHLADRIASNGSKRPTITKRWLDAARLMVDRDRREIDKIHKAIDWCQDDEFWRSNVLSMPTLREKYDQLRLAAQRGTGRPARPKTFTDQDRGKPARITSIDEWAAEGAAR